MSRMRESELMACECGNRPVLRNIDDTSGYAICLICKRCTSVHESGFSFGKTWKQKAIEEWNRRWTENLHPIRKCICSY